MKRVAAIDIGTNSMRLLLAELEKEGFTFRQKALNTTRIGRSVDVNRRISEDGIKVNIEAFSEFVKVAREWGAEEIAAIATSAVRDAANGRDFIELALKETGVHIRIISGEEEALLGYRGVLKGVAELPERLMVIDIGGGSTELIVGDERKIIKGVSLNMGSVRMTERVITADPIVPKEYQQLQQEIRDILAKELEGLEALKPSMLIGIGGTATTIAAIHQELEPYDPDRVHQYSLSLEEIEALLNRLMVMSLEDRRTVKGLHPQRADIIIAGITIMTTVMEAFGIKELQVSEYDNLEGMLASDSE